MTEKEMAIARAHDRAKMYGITALVIEKDGKCVVSYSKLGTKRRKAQGWKIVEQVKAQ